MANIKSIESDPTKATIMLEQAVSLLLSNQNGDGGFGAVAGKQSNTEATAFAVLALQSSPALAMNLDKAKIWLVKRQNADGSWPLNDKTQGPSWATALAIIALCEYQEQRERVVKAGNWVLAQEGGKPGLLAQLVLLVTRQKRAVRLNQDLIGWPWTTGNFSWIEPTSYFMIAVKKLKQELPSEQLKERIGQAELMIYDRMCTGGGWNYGNAEVYEESLWPYPDTTALALIATLDHHERKENQLSLQVLNQLAQQTDSGLALSWAAICGSLYGQDVASLRNSLAQRFAKTQFLVETKGLALAIVALGDGARYFRV
jgi:squalene cyclase